MTWMTVTTRPSLSLQKGYNASNSAMYEWELAQMTVYTLSFGPWVYVLFFFCQLTDYFFFVF
jgi:hypothetical protein